MEWIEGKLLELESERFLIRSMILTDITESYVSWWNDARLQDGFNMLPKNWKNKDALIHLMKYDNSKCFHLGIFRKGEGEQLGFVTIFVNREDFVAKATILIGDKKYWGSNVPKEVAGPVFYFLFGRCGIKEIRMNVASHNRASLAMCHRLGFTCESMKEYRNKQYPRPQRGSKLYTFTLMREQWQGETFNTAKTFLGTLDKR